MKSFHFHVKLYIDDRSSNSIAAANRSLALRVDVDLDLCDPQPLRSFALRGVADLVLVGRMKLRVLALASVLAGLTCCTSGFYHVQTAIRFRYPTLDIFGGAASQMTLDDIDQLVELARGRPDILKPLDQIEVQRPDEAYIKSGRPEHTGEKMTTFSARKKEQDWLIVPGSVNTGEAIITD